MAGTDLFPQLSMCLFMMSIIVFKGIQTFSSTHSSSVLKIGLFYSNNLLANDFSNLSGAILKFLWIYGVSDIFFLHVLSWKYVYALTN
jgi:hypothetical protein